MDKAALKEKILTIEGLSNEERAALLELLNTKRYGLVWENKPEDVEERLRDNLPVLKEVKERAIISDTPDAPNHILIEGDNLEALTALSYTHEGRIDVIYIDPPYNTGNKDFIYNDSFVDSEDGYRHSKWLSFMSKRLKIAKRLLKDDGILFMSIGSDEIAQSVSLCNDIYGEYNQITVISRVQKKGNGKGTHFSPAIDYILVYAKFKENVSRFYAPNTSDFPHIEKSGERAGEYYECTKSLYQGSLDSRPNQRYFIQCPDNTFVIPPGNVFPKEVRDAAYIKPVDNNDKCWRWSWDSYLRHKDLLVFKKVKRSTLVNESGEPSFWNVYTKRYQKDAEEKGKVPPNYIDNCINSLGTNRIGALGLDFSFAKPCELLMKLLGFSNKPSNICILDFFAGSGTSMDATMQLNSEDGGHRQCILVTNNENKICEEVTYERNKRVINGYTTPKGEQVEGLTNNTLRYYKTELLPREKSPRNMRALMAAATELLCIKEDLYEESKRFGRYRTNPKTIRYFEKGNKRMLIIFCEELADQIAEEIKTLDFGGDKLKIYIFSPDRYAFDDDFFEVQGKVQLVALPAAIYDAYRRVLPKQTDKPLLEVDESVTHNHGAEELTIDFNIE
ncbi:MAG: site-specific DNA-methyltransferase [Prevotella sp.]